MRTPYVCVCVPPDACRTRPVWVGVTHSVGVLFHFLCFLAFFQCNATGQSLSVATSVILLFVQGGEACRRDLQAVEAKARIVRHLFATAKFTILRTRYGVLQEVWRQ